MPGSRNPSPGGSAIQTASLSRDLRRPGGWGEQATSQGGLGHKRGVPSRSRTGSRSTPDDGSMRINHVAINQALYIEGRGALKREPAWCRRTDRALRAPPERSRRKTCVYVTPETLIGEHPTEAKDRTAPRRIPGSRFRATRITSSRNSRG